MARLEYGLFIDDMSEIFAATGDPLPPEDPSINIDRSIGFSPAMSLPGGPPVPRQLFQWAWRVFSTLGSEVNQHGVLEWSDQVNYLHTAQVSKNGRSFISTVNSGPGVPIGDVDPELAGQTAWVELLRVGLLRWNDIDGVLTVSKGGTGASSADGARNALNAAERGHSHSGFAPDPHTHPVASLDDLFGTLSVSKGGTGADSPAGARASLGAAAATHNHAGSELTVVIGAVVWWPGPEGNIPGGWREADGAAISRTIYALCFAAIGTAWGNGNGSTTFNIPNYQGRVLVGKRATDSVGDTGGARSVSLTAQQMPRHTHTGAAHTHTTPNHSHLIASHSHSVSSHSHSVSSHSHSVNNHSHSVSSHSHSVNNHSHSVSSHSHSVNNHSHSVSSHSHSVSSHSHSVAAHTHTVTDRSYSMGMVIRVDGSRQLTTVLQSISAQADTRTTSSGGPGSTGSAGPGSTGSAGGGSTSSAGPGSTGSAGGGSTSSAGPGSTGSAGGGSTGSDGPGSTGSAGGGATGSAGGGSTSTRALETDEDGGDVTGSAGSGNTGSAGSGIPHENMPPFSVGYWIIKIE